MLRRLKMWFALRKLKEVLAMPQINGYRTYIVIGLILAINVLEQYAGLTGLAPFKNYLYPIAIGFLRAGVKSTGK